MAKEETSTIIKTKRKAAFKGFTAKCYKIFKERLQSILSKLFFKKTKNRNKRISKEYMKDIYSKKYMKPALFYKLVFGSSKKHNLKRLI